jgi:phage-related protein
VSPRDEPLVWLRGQVKTPPFSGDARVEAGFLLRRVQRGETLHLPHSRPMPDIGTACHELRIADGPTDWRILYHIGADAIVVLEVFSKKTRATPTRIIADCRARLAEFQRLVGKKKAGPRAKRNAPKT